MKKYLLTLIVQSLVLTCFSQLTVSHLLCENLVNPIGIGETHPRFSWQLSSDKRNLMQTAYELKVSAGKKTIWNTGKVNSDQSVFVPYNGEELKTGNRYTWQLRVWDNKGRTSSWSDPATFQTASCKCKTGKRRGSARDLRKILCGQVHCLEKNLITIRK